MILTKRLNTPINQISTPLSYRQTRPRQLFPLHVLNPQPPPTNPDRPTPNGTTVAARAELDGLIAAAVVGVGAEGLVCALDEDGRGTGSSFFDDNRRGVG
jgi:hypothetical protein